MLCENTRSQPGQGVGLKGTSSHVFDVFDPDRIDHLVVIEFVESFVDRFVK
jgi:hypothetical protein